MYDVTKIKETLTQDGTRVIYAKPSNTVCPKQIAAAVKDGIVLETEFLGGCSGNTQGIGRLIAGMKVEEAISKLEGIKCGNKPQVVLTSCQKS